MSFSQYPALCLLLRHVRGQSYPSLLVTGPPGESALRNLMDQNISKRVIGYHWDASVFRGATLRPSHGPFSGAVVFADRCRSRTEILLRLTAEVVEEAANVFLVGENRIGVRTARGVFEREIGEIHETHIGQRCTLFRARKSYRTSNSAPDERIYRTQIRGIDIDIVTLPGVFSGNDADPGTRFLLENADLPTHGHLLDLGCGSGIVSAICRKRSPELSVTLSDSDAFALEAARRTFHRNRLTALNFIHSDGYTRIGGIYDTILCNPPFHRGRNLDHALETAGMLISNAPRFLRPGGRLIVGGNSFLAYTTRMKAAFGNVRIVATNGKYTVWESVREGGIG